MPPKELFYQGEVPDNGTITENNTLLDGTWLGDLHDKAMAYFNDNYTHPIKGSYARAYDGLSNIYNTVKDGALGWTPLGDVTDAISIADDVNKRNYGSAAMTAGLMFLPGSAGKLKNKIINTVDNYLNNGNLKLLDKLAFTDNKLVNFVLDRPYLTKKLLDWQLPKAERTRIFNDALNYNNSQLQTKLDVTKHTNLKEPSYTTPTLKSMLQDAVLYRQGISGPSAAHYSRNSHNIHFDYPSLMPSLANKIGGINGIHAHETRHGVQKTFTQPQGSYYYLDGEKHDMPIVSQKPLYNQGYSAEHKNTTDNLEGDILSGLFKSSYNKKTKNASNILVKANTNTWKQSLPEFDAEMARMREQLKINEPWENIPLMQQDVIKNTLSKRFNITPEQVEEIAFQLSAEGYKKGGVINYLNLFK